MLQKRNTGSIQWDPLSLTQEMLIREKTETDIEKRIDI